MNFNSYELPELNIIEPISYEATKQRLMKLVKAIDEDIVLTESCSSMIEIEAFAYELTHIDMQFNERIRSILPIYAKGNNLDIACKNFYGTVRLEDENDEAFLERSLLSLQQSSTAGAEWSYIYHVKSVDSRIVDVLPYRPVAGRVNVTWYANEADEDELLALEASIIKKLTDVKIKPIGDNTHYVGDAELHINRAIEVPFALNATLRIRLGVDGDAVRAESFRKLNEFILTLKIGQDVKVAKLIAVLDVDGVDEVVVVGPGTNVAIDKNSIAKMSEAIITVEGLNNE